MGTEGSNLSLTYEKYIVCVISVDNMDLVTLILHVLMNSRGTHPVRHAQCRSAIDR